MKTTQCFIKWALVVAMTMCSCTSSDNEPEINEIGREEIALSRAQKDLIDNETKFAFDFLKAVNEQAALEGKSNFVISPLSMARNLSMLACGATDGTLESILKILHLDNESSIEELTNLNRYLYDALMVADKKTELKISNSFWYDKNFPVKQSYLDLIGSNYNARSKKVDMSSTKTVTEINNWIKESTKGKIVDYFNSNDISDWTDFVLLDATYFKGTWRFSLDEKNTKAMTFFNKGVREVKVPTMNRTDYVMTRVGGDDNATMLELNYGNRAFSMFLIMADEGYDINDIIREFDFNRWCALKNTSRELAVKFSLPKFNVKYEPDLTDALKGLGLSCVTPNLNNMTNSKIDGLKIGQSSSIEVDESGAIFASTTSTVNDLSSFIPTNREYIHINRPFIFLIEEFSTGAIICAGKVEEL